MISGISLAAPNRQALAAPLGTNIAPSSKNRASGVSCTPWLDGRGRRRAAPGLGRAGHRRAARHGVNGAPAATGHALATAPRVGPTGHRGRPRQARDRTEPPHAAARATHAGGHARGRPSRGAPWIMRLPHPHGLDRRVVAGHPAAILPPRVAADDGTTGAARHAPSARPASRSWPHGSSQPSRHPVPLRNPANYSALAAPLAGV